MQGLQSCIGLSVVHPTWQRTKPDIDDHSGWVFASPDDPPLSNTNGSSIFLRQGVCLFCGPDVDCTASSKFSFVYALFRISNKRIMLALSATVER